ELQSRTIRAPLRPPRPTATPLSPYTTLFRSVCMWADALQLSRDQQEQLVAVYRQGEVAIDSIQRQIRPPIDSIYQTIRPAIDSQRIQLREQVKALLTPEQREKYDSTTTAWDEQRRQNRDRQPGGPGPQGGPSRDRP